MTKNDDEEKYETDLGDEDADKEIDTMNRDKAEMDGERGGNYG